MIPTPEQIPLDILFEDADILVVNKPAGMIVHPAPGHETGTLVNALLAHCPSMFGIGSAERSGIVHRLDRETSGVMVTAKNLHAYRILRSAFETHSTICKTYLAVLHGVLSQKRGRIEAPIGRKPWDAKRMAVIPIEAGGKQAVSHWEVLERRHKLSLVEFVIETGRMHQIRVHAAHIGNPIAGDPLYGNAVADRRMIHKPTRTLLHAVMLAFNHPRSGERMTFAAPPPADILYAQ